MVVVPSLSDCHEGVARALDALEDRTGFYIVGRFPGRRILRPRPHDDLLVHGTAPGRAVWTERQRDLAVRTSGTRATRLRAVPAFRPRRPRHRFILMRPSTHGLLTMRAFYACASQSAAERVNSRVRTRFTTDSWPRSRISCESSTTRFVFDRRGEYEPGDSATSEASVFSWDGAELTVRYLDLYIREGHRLAERRLTKEQQSALRAIENLCSDPVLQVEFGLEPGQMLFVNNHWILHNRTKLRGSSRPHATASPSAALAVATTRATVKERRDTDPHLGSGDSHADA